MLPMKSKSESCSRAQSRLSVWIDGQAPADEQKFLDLHLDACGDCAAKARATRRLQSALRSLPLRVPPAALATRLRVVASQERARRERTATLAMRWSSLNADMRLWANNLMRPFAIPATGGFFSAVLLFAMMLPGLNVRAYATGNDIPTGLYTDPSAKNVIPLAFNDDDLVVEVTVDETGRMVDYHIADCKHIIASPRLRKAVEANLLFSEFTPATTFGQPRLSKIRISFHNSKIDVQG
jgi:hypothetical protein